ncbi:MAG: hypothetical protein ACD_73C00181G0003 [uncultured bacterium]|nr:MAG: hypothetical protein ACD_73C00181G0003 [uncultured bacterium]
MTNSQETPCSRSQSIVSFSLRTPLLFLISTSTRHLRALRILSVLVITIPPRALVSCDHVVTAEIPIPCCPRLQRPRPNFELAKYSPNTFTTSSAPNPGPLSSTRTRTLSEPFDVPSPSFSIKIFISGKIPAVSQASSELSTASLIVVSRALV